MTQVALHESVYIHGHVSSRTNALQCMSQLIVVLRWILYGMLAIT